MSMREVKMDKEIDTQVYNPLNGKMENDDG